MVLPIKLEAHSNTNTPQCSGFVTSNPPFPVAWQLQQCAFPSWNKASPPVASFPSTDALHSFPQTIGAQMNYTNSHFICIRPAAVSLFVVYFALESCLHAGLVFLHKKDQKRRETIFAGEKTKPPEVANGMWCGMIKTTSTSIFVVLYAIFLEGQSFLVF